MMNADEGVGRKACPIPVFYQKSLVSQVTLISALD